MWNVTRPPTRTNLTLKFVQHISSHNLVHNTLQLSTRQCISKNIIYALLMFYLKVVVLDDEGPSH